MDVFLVDYMPKENTIYAYSYCDIIENYQNQLYGMLTVHISKKYVKKREIERHLPGYFP